VDRVPKEVATTIILTVYRAGKLTMSELYEKTKFSTITILNHVNALVKAGLLEEEREGVFPKRRLINASKEGLRVAALLNLADGSALGTFELIDMGAKAGRIASYQEMLTSLRNPNATRDYLTAELYIKRVGSLAAGLSAVTKGFPENMKEKAELLKTWVTKLETHYAEGMKYLSSNDVGKCVNEVTKALAEFNGAVDLMKEIAKSLKEQKYDEIANYVEFLSPKVTQKE